MRLSDVFIVGEKYAELTQDQIPLAALKKNPLIFMENGTISRRSLDNFFQSLGIELAPSIEVGSWDLMKRLVKRGMGIGVIPREYVAAEMENGTIAELKTDLSLPVRSVGMLLPKQAPVPYALHCFIEEFRKER